MVVVVHLAVEVSTIEVKVKSMVLLLLISFVKFVLHKVIGLRNVKAHIIPLLFLEALAEVALMLV